MARGPRWRAMMGKRIQAMAVVIGILLLGLAIQALVVAPCAIIEYKDSGEWCQWVRSIFD